MYELLLCHRRAHWVTPGAFFDHWRTRRRDVVDRLQPDLGFTTYTQLHRAARLNVLYLAIRFSRSWPVTALLSIAQRLPIPRLFDRAGSGSDERWDVVETFRFPSHERLTAVLASPEGRNALTLLQADALGRVRHTAAIVAETLAVADDPSLGYPRTVTRFCLRARRPLTHGAMLERWQTSHKSLVVGLRSALGYRAYDQLYAELAPDAEARGFDGVAMLAYDAQKTLLRRLFDVRTQLANFKLVRDEVQFIDLRRSALVFGEESVC